jgi:hypothetical protein
MFTTVSNIHSAHDRSSPGAPRPIVSLYLLCVTTMRLCPISWLSRTDPQQEFCQRRSIGRLGLAFVGRRRFRGTSSISSYPNRSYRQLSRTKRSDSAVVHPAAAVHARMVNAARCSTCFFGPGPHSGKTASWLWAAMPSRANGISTLKDCCRTTYWP